MAAAPPPPPPPPTSLEDLPDDILHLILSRIPCRDDRGLMSHVCRAWRDLIRRHRAQPPLPLLLLTAFSNGSTRVACVLGGCRIHHYLTITPPGARCFGSHDGVWLFLHYHDREPRGNHACNVLTGDVEPLPARLLDQAGVHNMVILAAALSSSPDDASYVAAAIVVVPWHMKDVLLPRRCVAFWRKGSELAHQQVPPDADDAALVVDDVVYHDGAFHMLTPGNHIRVCKPTIEHQNDGNDGMSVNWKTRHFQFQSGVPIRDQFVRSRYLVHSRGELLMVVRFTPEPNQPTSKFKVYRETDADANNPVPQYPWAWRELDTLGGRMLFVGYGCSRSYEVDEYPGFKDGIYFMDDGEFYDVQVIFGIGWQCPCSDNGKWSEGRVQRCFPVPHPSDHSAPAWLLH